MKTILLAAMLCLCGMANATNYYFSSVSGDDSRTSAQAQNPNTPWKTITKLNAIFSTLVAGDSILFKRGEIFYGSITIGKSGTASNPIKFGAFGTGAKPEVTGFVSVSAWTNISSNIWESTAAVSTLSSCNIISINGANAAQGRTPDAGYWTIGGTNGNSITDATNLNAATVNWTGAQVVLRKYRWIMDRYTITSASGNTINFTNGGDAIQTGWGYFIQNDIRTLNLQNEWCYNATTKKIAIYSTTSPVNVSVPTIDVAVNMNSKDYITFDNINFTGFNSTGINTTSRTGITIQNCDFKSIGVNAIYGYPNSGNIRVTGSTFTDINSRGIHAGSSSNAFISGNTLRNIGHYAGMGSNGDDSYTAIISHGDDGEVSYNSITNAGYVGIRWDGHGTVIKNNFVNTTNYIKDDGGGIYCYPNQLGPVAQTFAQRTVRDNIVINSIGAIAGGTPSSNASEGMGIYADGTSPNIDFINNTIANCRLGLFLNNSHEVNVTGNTIYDCARGLYLIKYSADVPISNVTVTNNVFTAKTASQYTAYYEPGDAVMPSDFSANNNYYARPIDDNKTIWQDVNGTNVYRTLAEWKSATGKDPNSQKSSKTTTNVYDLRFIYNETNVSKTISLGANYLDVKNVSYPGSITLAPYSSALLIKNDATNIPPVADAGTDKEISVPAAVVLAGSGEDYDGTISTYTWTKISGPSTGSITGANTQTPTLTGLTNGTYKYELRVTDNNGAIGRDTVTVNFATIIVPVILVDFSGVAKPDKTAFLQWSTSSEINSDYFIVEKSTDGRNFSQLAVVNAQGNSNHVVEYQLTDMYPSLGVNYYRLKMVDNDTRFEYSNIISVTIKNTINGSVAIVSTGAYRNRFEVNLYSDKAQPATYAIFDATGRMLFKSDIMLQPGSNGIYRNIMLPESVYYFKLVAGQEKFALPLVNRN